MVSRSIVINSCNDICRTYKSAVYFTLKPVGVDGGAVVGTGAVVAGFDGTLPAVVPVGGGAVLGDVVMTSVGTAVGTEVGGNGGGEPEQHV